MPSSTRWTELYCRERVSPFARFEIEPLDKTPLVLRISSAVEEMAARVAYFLQRETGCSVRLATPQAPSMSPTEVAALCGPDFSVEAACQRAEESVWHRSPSTMKNANWKPCSLEELTPLQHDYLVGTLPMSGHPVLQVGLQGELANRLTWSFDVACARIFAGLEAWAPFALVLDLRQVAYEWGDGMEGVLTAGNRWVAYAKSIRKALTFGKLPDDFPTAVVTSPANREGLESLLEATPTITVRLCDSTDQAVATLDHILRDVPPL